MVEKKIRIAYLPNEISENLINRNPTLELVEQVEALTNAYFGRALDQNFMGAVRHELSQRYVVKESNFRSLAVNNAVIKIGSQSLYWKKFHEQMLSGEAFKVQTITLSMLEIGKDNEIWVTDLLGELSDFDRELLDPGDFNAMVLLYNMAGDADFWGIDEPSIFPIRVRVGTLPYDQNVVWGEVGATELGLTRENEIKSWEAWNNLREEEEASFSRNLRQMMSEGALDGEVVELVHSADMSGDIVRSELGLYKLMFRRDFSEERMDHVMNQINEKVGKDALNLGMSGGVIKASWELANELDEMWKTAQGYTKS